MYHPVRDIAKGDTIIYLDQVAKLSKGSHITIERPGLLEASQLTSGFNLLCERQGNRAVKAGKIRMAHVSKACVENRFRAFFCFHEQCHQSIFHHFTQSGICRFLWLWSSKRKWEPNSPVKFGLASPTVGTGLLYF
jgi:hypothetical protein